MPWLPPNAILLVGEMSPIPSVFKHDVPHAAARFYETLV